MAVTRAALPLARFKASATAKPLYSVQRAIDRRHFIERHFKAMRDLLKVTDIPTHEVAANQIILRFVPFPSKYPLNYAGVMSLPPDIKGGAGVGGYSANNRFSGVQPDGSIGLNASYWGLPDGVAAEDLYYSCLKDYDGSGPKRLMASTTPLAVQWTKGLLGYGVDSEIPRQLVFSGNCCTDVVVARTIRKIVSVNLNLGDPRVHTALDAATSRWRALLDGFEYNSIQEGIADPFFPDFARFVALGASEKVNPDAIWAQSARVEAATGLEGFNPAEASNLVMVGKGRDTLTDRLVALGVIQIRSDSSGVHATVEPMHGPGARYDDGVNRALAIIPKA